jgi:hypothetical protein
LFTPGELCAPDPLTDGNAAQRQVGFDHRTPRVAVGRADQPGGHALFVLQQRLEQVFGRDLLVRQADRDGLRTLQKAFRAVGEFFEVHVSPTPLTAR